MNEKDWVEIRLVDQDGKAVAGEEYLIVTADYREFRGSTNTDGVARVDGIQPGTCSVSFTSLDDGAWFQA